MTPPLRFAAEVAYALSRIVAGLMFAVHGAQKAFPILGTDGSVELASRLGLATIIELAGGGLIALGLWTPWVAFVASGEMAFAYFLAHHPRGWVPLENGGETAVLYAFVFLMFASRGSGPYSVDRLIGISHR